MTTLETRCLEAFPAWLRTLGEDAKLLATVLESSASGEHVRRRSAAALTYLFKSLDLIPDGLEDLGFVDDAFVFRVAAGSVEPGDAAADASGTVTRLAGEAGLIREFLGEVYERLATYVASLEKSSARGRSVDEVIADPAKCAELVREVRQWAEGYEIPSFTRDEKNLVKLRSFLAAKLRA
ncbi:MAG TPA: YkvA family protein [Polyangiaceae bacterium]|nr:YkvA family protein [Polyangiaceae bacterium]